MSEIVLVLTTVPSDFSVSRLARALLDERHAMCVSALPPMESVYRWKDKLEQARERQLLIKTTADKVPGLEVALKAQHPYEVPEFLVLSVAGGSEAYLAWLRGA
jgi:periplasmic divalent cation tolerance protein